MNVSSSTLPIPEFRPATVADLMSPEICRLVIEGLRAEGWLVIEKVDGEWPEWAMPHLEKFSLRGKYLLDDLAEVGHALHFMNRDARGSDDEGYWPHGL